MENPKPHLRLNEGEATPKPGGVSGFGKGKNPKRIP